MTLELIHPSCLPELLLELYPETFSGTAFARGYLGGMRDAVISMIEVRFGELDEWMYLAIMELELDALKALVPVAATESQAEVRAHLGPA